MHCRPLTYSGQPVRLQNFVQCTKFEHEGLSIHPLPRENFGIGKRLLQIHATCMTKQFLFSKVKLSKHNWGAPKKRWQASRLVLSGSRHSYRTRASAQFEAKKSK